MKKPEIWHSISERNVLGFVLLALHFVAGCSKQPTYRTDDVSVKDHEKSEIRSLICTEERRIVQLCAANDDVHELNEGSCYIHYRKEQDPDDMRYTLYEEYYVNFKQKTFVERYPSLGCAKFGVIGIIDISPEDSNIVKMLWTENSMKIIVRDVDRPYVYRVRTEIEDRGDYFLFNGLVFKKERQ